MLRLDDDVDKEQRYFSFRALQDSVKRTSRTPFTRVLNLGLGTEKGAQSEEESFTQNGKTKKFL